MRINNKLHRVIFILLLQFELQQGGNAAVIQTANGYSVIERDFDKRRNTVICWKVDSYSIAQVVINPLKNP